MFRKISLIFAVIATVFVPLTAVAENASELSSQLSEQNRKAAEVTDRISNVDAQLAVVEAQIASTQADIAATTAAIEDAKARMAGYQATLSEYIRTEYKTGRQSGLEMLVGSHSLSQFFDRQEYVKAGQDKISETVNAIVQTKKQLDAKSADLNRLNAQLAAAQNGLNYQRSVAAGELATIEAARAEVKAKLARYGGQVVAAGDHVNAGDLIGFEGTSGCSTGPHVHFEVQRGGTPINPRIVTPGQFRWPLDDGFGVAQEFGRPNWAAPYSFHSGIDINQYFGAPVYAAAAGTVAFSGYDRSGFGDHVIIDHGGGLRTIYGHMGARASDYPNC